MNSLDITSLYTNLPIKNVATSLLLTEEKLNPSQQYP